MGHKKMLLLVNKVLIDISPGNTPKLKKMIFCSEIHTHTINKHIKTKILPLTQSQTSA